MFISGDMSVADWRQGAIGGIVEWGSAVAGGTPCLAGGHDAAFNAGVGDGVISGVHGLGGGEWVMDYKSF